MSSGCHFPEATIVARHDANAVVVHLADRDGNPASVDGLTAVVTENRHLVASFLIGGDGSLTLVPIGRPGRVAVQVKLPTSHGVREVLFSVALVHADDPRLGLGAVEIR